MDNVRLLIVMAIAIVYSAVVSNGFYHYDEHFMISEFVGLKLGITPADGLPWEYGHRMRPWMQPALYYGLSQLFLLAGLEDPFLLALLFRLASGAVFFVGIWLLMRGLPRLIDTEEGQRAAAKVLTLSWFIPVLAVRTSSESLSAAMICITLGCVLAAFDHPSGWRGRAWFAAAGLAQGFAFQFRFQVAFIILGLFAWLFWIKRVRRTDFLLMAGVSLASLGLGLLVDAWGYGRFTVASYHYLDQNLLQAHVANFGVSPVYGYFVLAATNYMAPFTLAMALALLVMWIRRPLHPVTWITVPFVLAHTLTCFRSRFSPAWPLFSRSRPSGTATRAFLPDSGICGTRAGSRRCSSSTWRPAPSARSCSFACHWWRSATFITTCLRGPPCSLSALRLIRGSGCPCTSIADPISAMFPWLTRTWQQR
jgi:phosphatidylinositol glycan class B